MREYIVKTLEGTTKLTAPSPAKAAKIAVGSQVERCKHRECTVIVRRGKYSAYYKEG